MFATVMLLFNKTNIMQTITEQLTTSAANLGLALMSIAVVTGLVEIPVHDKARAVLPIKAELAPAPAVAENAESTLRREKEESGPHYVSYSVAQRTPARSARK